MEKMNQAGTSGQIFWFSVKICSVQVVSLHPYFGAGISYLDEEKLPLAWEDGFTWNIFIGSEITSFPIPCPLMWVVVLWLWSEFGENDFTLDTGLSWWIDYQNGVSVEYQYSLEHEVNYLTLQVFVFLAVKS